MDEKWVEAQSLAIGEHCRKLMVRVGDSVESGDMASASAAAQELGDIVGKLASRAFTLQMLADDLVTDAGVRAAVTDVLAATRLPTE